MASSRFERLSDLDRMLGDLEQRLSRLSRIASRASAAAPDTAGRIGDTIASALGLMAERFRGWNETRPRRVDRATAGLRRNSKGEA